MISLIGLHISGGSYLSYINKERCEDKCFEDDRCFAFEYIRFTQHGGWDTCIIYQRRKSNLTSSSYYPDTRPKEEGFGAFILFDVLKLLGHTFRIEKVAIHASKQARKNMHAQNENVCREECHKDRVCAAITYNTKDVATDKNNCKLYSQDKILCPEDEKNCKVLEEDKDKYTDYITVFNP